MRLYKDNLSETATITVSSEIPGSGVDKLLTRKIADRFLFDEIGGSITVDLSTSKDITDLFLGGITGSWIVEGHTENVWTTPSYSHSIDSEEETGWLELQETYRWWRFTTADDTGLGLLFICDSHLQLPGISLEVDLYYNTTSIGEASLGGSWEGDEGYDYLSTTFKFPQITEGIQEINGIAVATRKDILNYWSDVKNITPFWIKLWEKNLDEYLPFLGTIETNKLKVGKLKDGKVYKLNLPLREVK